MRRHALGATPEIRMRRPMQRKCLTGCRRRVFAWSSCEQHHRIPRTRRRGHPAGRPARSKERGARASGRTINAARSIARPAAGPREETNQTVPARQGSGVATSNSMPLRRCLCAGLTRHLTILKRFNPGPFLYSSIVKSLHDCPHIALTTARETCNRRRKRQEKRMLSLRRERDAF